ncbi:unnamed protein product [Caenorhabditis auriculariae]|uniref:Mitochondria-eating protein n=1 Tax=Caenorhabditis auriculariae TaxID=2777116 RepID=A0A8S1GW94_9PELO|nr:unnamed protein product [Caenorhabditis auriculariae]
MEQNTSKSAGWSFKPPRQELNLIKFCSRFEPLDMPTIAQLREEINAAHPEDMMMFLNILPPMEQIIQQIPYTLPLLETIFHKCISTSEKDGVAFPKNDLCCDQLFCQLVWWMAFSEQTNSPALRKHLPSFLEYQSCVQSLMSAIGEHCPHLIRRAQEDRSQMAACLESLGCHGLVNCSSGLIRITDAVYLEMLKYLEHIKMLCLQVKEFSTPKVGGSADPSFESHQRQMSMRLSQVYQRLKLNETIECFLTEVCQNQQITSLLRIVRKRVGSDKSLIGLFNAFSRAAPDDFELQQLDPIIAQLIVLFKNSYDKLLSMCPTNKIGNEGSPTISNTSTSSSRTCSSSNTSNFSTSDNDNEKENVRIERLKDEVQKLRKELRLANYTITELRKKVEASEEPSECSIPFPDYPDATSYYNCSAKEQISLIVKRLSELFIYASNDVRGEIDNFPEFLDQPNLQMEVILRSLLGCHTAVLNYVKGKKSKLIIEKTSSEDEPSTDAHILDASINAFLYRQFKTKGEQISHELIELQSSNFAKYPSLQSSFKFKRFLEECLAVCWDIVCGVEKRLTLEYEGEELVGSRHSRGTHSSSSSRIRQFLWPGLVDANSNRVYLKAIVLT